MNQTPMASQEAPRPGTGRRLFRASSKACRAMMLLAFVPLALAVFAQPSFAQTQDPERDRNTPFGSPVPDAAAPRGETRDADGRAYETRPTEAVDINANAARAGNLAERDPTQMLTREELLRLNPRLKPVVPSEFELHVERTLGRKLPRFGSDLLLPGNGDYALPATATVPPDYVLNVGDTVSIAMTGSVEGSVDLQIDTDGRIFLPRIGPVMLAGVRYRDLRDRVSEAIGRQYRGYTVTVGIRELRGIRVYVTGYANNPGAYSVNSLSTMVNAVLAAGGPSSGGSLRSAKLYRNGALVGDLDLYDLILRGDKSRDAILQNEDVVFIEPLGEQIAITGSVNAEAVFEVRPGETLDAVLGYAGGAGVLADRSRLLLFRLSDMESRLGREVALAEARAMPVEGGDIVQLLSQGTIQQPLERVAVLVRVEGEVANPGNYFVAPGTPLDEVLARAGGLTQRAFVFGTKLERASVKRQQQESFQEAIRQLEISLAATPLTGDRIDPRDEAAQLAAAREVLQRMRQAEPDGRVVLDLSPNAVSLPGDLVLETNDRIHVPPRPTTVGVFGAVYRPASFLLDSASPRTVRDYVERSGGTLRSADKAGIFVVRANGEVLTAKNGALKSRPLPGDVVFVPVKTRSPSIWTKLRDISAVIFQLGLGAAAFVAVTQ